MTVKNQMVDYAISLYSQFVDYQANLNLLNEARENGVRKFIYVSLLNGERLRHLKICDAKDYSNPRLGAYYNTQADQSFYRQQVLWTNRALFNGYRDRYDCTGEWFAQASRPFRHVAPIRHITSASL